MFYLKADCESGLLPNAPNRESSSLQENYHHNASEEMKEYCKMCEAMLYE